MPATYYPAIIDRSASGFGVTFPDFPGCIANGATINEAAINGEAALALHVEAMVKDKDALPDPSDFAEVVKLDQPDDVAGVMIRANVPVKVERVLISLDSALLRAIDAVASNRSAWLAEAARAALRQPPGASALAQLARVGRAAGKVSVLPGAGSALEQLRAAGESALADHVAAAKPRAKRKA